MCFFITNIIDLIGKNYYNGINLSDQKRCHVVDGREKCRVIRLMELDAKRRDAILNAALKEFAVKGFDHASTNIIAKEAGISKPLMFHYVENKKELFLAVYDYFSELLDQKYYQRINYEETDLLERLRQSFMLQAELLRAYPWIYELHKLSGITDSEEINDELEQREGRKHADCYLKIFEDTDLSKFRRGLNAERCKKIIFWSCTGFANKIAEEVRSAEYSFLDYEELTREVDIFFQDLREIYDSPEI